MNAESIVKKLFLVEDDSTKIWAALKRIYGDNFFKSVIERDMGVSSDYKEKLEYNYK